MNKYVTKILSIVLAGIIGVSASVEGFSALANTNSETHTEYLSDITIAKASSSTDAEKQLTDKGYTVYNQDLMEGAGGDTLYLGYKTTNDKSKAVTDISMMNMDGGFEDVKYRDIAEKQLPEIDSMTEDLYLIIQEFRKNIENENPAAQTAYKSLNLFNYVPLDEKIKTGSDSGMYLGYWMGQSNSVTTPKLKDMLLICNQRVISYIYGMLALGLADYNESGEGLVDPTSDEESSVISNPTNWVERMASYTPEDFEDLTDAETEEYREATNELLPQIENFADEYNDAKERAGDTEDGILPNTDCGFIYLSCYEFLNKYQYDGVGIGDYFLGLADGSYDAKTACYPLAKALTRGQRAIIRAGFLTSLLLGIDNGKDKFKELRSEINGFIKDINKEADGGISIWYGTDPTLYDQTVALTDEAARAATASARYDYLNPTVDTTNDKIDKVIDTAEATMKCSFGAALIVISGFSACLGTGSSILGTIAAVNALASTSAGFLVGAICMWTPIVIGIVCIAVIFWCLVTKLVIWAKEKYDYYHPTYTSIPDTMFSFDNDEYIKYSSVNNIKTGKPIDINDSQGNTWNALYYTTDTSVGDPIEVKVKTAYSGDDEIKTYLEDIFKSKKGDGTTPKGYKPVASFGEKIAANLNFGAYKDKYKGIYLFFKRTDGDEKKDVAGDGSKYITSIKIFSDKKDESARLAAQREGYTILNRNLTRNEYSYSTWNFFTGKSEPKISMYSSCSTELYTYLAYKTTTNKNSKNLVTDIRVTYNYAPKDTAFTYGTASYANAGTFNNISVWYTTMESAGDPIVDDFVVSTTNGETPSGYEAVSLFADTNAFDLNYVDGKRAAIHPDPVFLYFKSSVEYDDEEYIGGITFVNSYMKDSSTSKEKQTTIDEVGKYFFSDLVGDVRRWGGYSTLYHYYSINSYKDTYTADSYMKFSFTKNPKRAITNIYSYNGLAKNVGAPDNMTIESKGYAVSKSYYYSNMNGFYSGDNNGDALNIADSNSYAPLNNEQDGSGIFGCNGYAKALYMCGPTGDTKDALTRFDIKFADSSAIPSDSFKAVNDITLLEYADSAANLSNNILNDNKNSKVYMFLRTSNGEAKFRQKKTAEDEGKYISSLISTNPDAKTEALYKSQYVFTGYDGKEVAAMERIISALSTPGGQLMSYTASNSDDKKTLLTVALRVERTNDYNKALTDVKFKVYTDNTPTDNTITINDTEYQNCGKVGEINGKKYGAPGHSLPGTPAAMYNDFSVYMYTTKNASIDSAICDYSFDGSFYSSSMSTAYFMNVDNVYNDDEYTTYKNKRYENFAGDKYPFEYFMHFKHETKYDKYISQIKIFSADTKKNAIAEMAQEGFRYFYDCDLNSGYTDGTHYYTYLAYKTDDRNGITNIVALPVDLNSEESDIPNNIYLMHRNSTVSDNDKNDVTAGAYGKYFENASDAPSNKYYKSVKYNKVAGLDLNGKASYSSDITSAKDSKKLVLYYTKSKYAGGKNISTTKGTKTTTTLTADPIVSFGEYTNTSQEAIYNVLNGEAADANYCLHTSKSSPKYVYIAVNRESKTPIKKADFSNIKVASAFTKPFVPFIIGISALALLAIILAPVIKKKREKAKGLEE